ncbi:LuxR C-terminal-related transcriptional regulator [Streptacidiphilus sp. P02-A3a]|uniref:LuxR C-terminal-related transcriptional regulator n=1 Tax=Streptacidiphilus sp. P02-A3a TaxID=2704468 RepID=UPI0015FCF900|nr:helix-turn-helix transcriptional regulator [Streptacidiphilus sp. P02-A3a]QMU70741.1 helix-turn-helix transcriptional regulator [Streptacidiphilus sp. P02-A3a]
MTPLRGTAAAGATSARRTPAPEDGCAAAEPARRRPARRGGREAGSAEVPPCQERLTALGACILEGVASGASTAELAAALYLSRQGVEYHIGLMLRQFKVPNRAALVSRAHSLGVLSVGSWPPRVMADFVE